MKETNFELKQNINKSIQEDTPEDNIEKAKKDLYFLSEELLKYQPETKEFYEIQESFIKIQPIIEEGIKDYIKRKEEMDFYFSMDRKYALYFKLADKFGLLTESSKEMASRLFMVCDNIDRIISDDILSKRELYKSKEKNINQEDYLAGYILKKFDFSENEVKDLIQSWLSIEDNHADSLYIDQNLRNIRGLERFENKSVKYLYDNFGIRSFGRYTMRELKKQYQERDDMGRYGLYFQAVMDWNASFSQSNQTEDIRDKVEENDFILRIIEANGKIDFAKRLLFLRDKYNQKIKFMYMNVHGNTNVMGLGDREGSDRRFLQEDLKGKGVQRIKELFDDNAELVLSSCLTGAEGGLAEEISRVYNVKVIASDKLTKGEPKSVNIKKNPAGDNLEFEVVFNTADEENDKTRKGTVIYNPKH